MLYKYEHEASSIFYNGWKKEKLLCECIEFVENGIILKGIKGRNAKGIYYDTKVLCYDLKSIRDVKITILTSEEEIAQAMKENEQ